MNPWPRPKLGRHKQKAAVMRPAARVVPEELPNQAQAERLLAGLVNKYRRYSLLNYAFVGTIYATAARPFEVAGLMEWDLDIDDVENAWLHVQGGKPGGVASRFYDLDEEMNPTDERTGPKAKARDEAGRFIPIYPWWATELQRVFELCPPKNGIAFATETGTSPAPSNIARALVRSRRQELDREPMVPVRPGSTTMRANPLATVVPYSFRHARANEWLRIEGHDKVAIGRIAKWMGHSPEVLLSTYTNCISGDEETSIAVMKAACPSWRGPSTSGLWGPGHNMDPRTLEVVSYATQEVA